MSAWDGLCSGFSIVFTPETFLFCFFGVLMGTLVGVLPGLGPVGAMSLLLPLTFSQNVTTAQIMLCGIYYGAMYGGSTTSILVNVPGEAASVITCIDGYQMAKQGRAGPALAIAAIGSFIAGTLGVFLLMMVAPPLARVALKFGPPEFFAIALLGLLVLSRLTGKSALKSYVLVLAGTLVATVGVDPVSGYARFAFGYPKLLEGIDFMPVVMGLYGIGEVLGSLRDRDDPRELRMVRTKDLIPTRQDFKDSAGPILRGGMVGFFLGLIPGPANIISTFVSYGLERKLSPRAEEFGRGAIAGVAGPESANNGATAGALVPLLSLGIPFSPIPAILLAGFMIHGVLPGPLLIKNHPDVFWGIIASMYVGNVMLLILNLPLVGLFARVALIPSRILMPIVLIFCFLGAFAVRHSLFDLYVLIIFGVIGYLFRLRNYDPAPLALGLIIGPMLEDSLRQSMIMFGGDYLSFFRQPLSGLLLSATILVGFSPLLPKMGWRIGRRRKG
jgi:putative tricarboxylic transport membrane protein